MADSSQSQINMDENTPKAAKDKSCPYCGQAFTSSSLGRHLDLYIKPRNPKKPDGIHDVDEIRRTRGGVTRRQPKGSVGRRNTSTPAATPAGPSRRADDTGDDNSNAPSPSNESSVPVTSAAGFLIGPGAGWEAVNTTAQHPQTPAGTAGEGPRDLSSSQVSDATARIMYRQAQKAQLDMRQKLQDAQDDARAAELALREFTNAWRAAKHQIEAGNSPFDFDPLTMNFPALTLQCLRPMPTLFASTQLPTPSSSWSISPPGEGQFGALKDFFKEEFRKFRAKCVAQTKALNEEPKHPQLLASTHAENRQAAEATEKRVDALEKDATEHLEIAYANWKDLSHERKTELWVLELARGIATKQNDLERLAAAKSNVVQENANLKSQIEQLNRQQRPQEFSVTAPTHMPMNDRVLFQMQDAALTRGSSMVGLDIGNRNSDYETFITSSIKRWKGVVKSTRASGSGMSAQRPLGALAAGGPVTTPFGAGANTQAGQPRRQLAPPPVPVTFAVSTPASLASTGGVQKQTRRNTRAGPARQPVPSGSNPAPTAPVAFEASTTRTAPAASVAPSAPMAPMETAPESQLPPPRQASRLVTAKAEPHSDNMDVEEEDEDEEEEEEEEEDEEDEEDEEEEQEAEDDDEDDDDGDDDTTPPAQQPQQAPTAPGAAGGRGPGGGNADDNDDEDDEMSDKDADAEMEDDGDEFAHMHTPLNMSASSTGPGSLPNPPDQKLGFPYARNADHQVPRTAGNTSASLINSSQLMPNMGLAMPALSGESMYMD